VADDDGDEVESEVPVGEVLAGLTTYALRESWTPLEAVLMIKCLDDAGEVRWAMRSTAGLNSEELLGAMILRTDMLRQDMLDAYEP
jgi:hypothetical protein